MDSAEWLEKYTVPCGLGRVTSSVCESMRQRRFLKEVFVPKIGWRANSKADRNQAKVMPAACEACSEWETLQKKRKELERMASENMKMKEFKPGDKKASSEVFPTPVGVFLIQAPRRR